MKFKISKQILEKFPNVVEYVVVGLGLNNEVASKEINDLLDNTAKKLVDRKDLLLEDRFSRWVDIYDGIKNGYKPSHVALVERAMSGKRIPHINPIVNLYNYYSIKYGLPIGGEDMSSVYGDLELKIAGGDELFLGIGGKKVEKIEKGEVIWVDDHSVTSRMWAYRQSERTKLDKNSKDVYFIIDSFSDFEIDEVVEKFVKDLKKYFGGEYQILKLDNTKNTLTVKYKTRVVKSDHDTNRDFEQLIGTGKNVEDKSHKSRLQRRVKSLDLKDESNLSWRLSMIVDGVLSKIGVSESSELHFSSNLSFGDFSSTLLIRESKKTGKPTSDLGQKIVDQLLDSPEVNKVFSKIECAKNGFLNFFMSEKFLLSELSDNVGLSVNFGKSKIGGNRVFVVESPSINPNAPAHVGHLRNLLLGRGLSRLLEKVGFKVEKDNLINDKDNKVCMAMWGYERFGGGKNPEDEKMKSDHFVGKYYALGRKEYNNNESAKSEIDLMLKKLEENDEKIVNLWKKITDWAFMGQLDTFERLGEDRGFLWYESDLWEDGKKLIEKYIGGSVVEKLPDGAVVGRIEEEYGVPDVVLLRSDGTSLYHTQDFSLTIRKIEKYQPWKAIWVVGNEHILHFQRLFALLDALQVLKIDNLYAYVYGMVLGKDGKKISSRSGEDANTDQLLDMARDAALEVLKDREIEDDKKLNIAEKVGQGAIRFEILSKDPYKDIILDLDKAVSFTGKSGSYVMYAYTRAKNILKNIGDLSENIDKNYELNDIERSLILKVLKYPEVVISAANNYAPSIVAEYSYEIANIFNNFYEKCPVSSADGNQKYVRKLIVELTSHVLKDSLGILGIQVIDEM